jgi:hypothetical protein
MAQDKKTSDTDRPSSGQANEGEGNRTAAKQYEKAQREFVQSGNVDRKAREAEQAIDGDEAKELERAEAEGKRHIAEEDPEIKR